MDVCAGSIPALQAAGLLLRAPPASTAQSAVRAAAASAAAWQHQLHDAVGCLACPSWATHWNHPGPACRRCPWATHQGQPMPCTRPLECQIPPMQTPHMPPISPCQGPHILHMSFEISNATPRFASRRCPRATHQGQLMACTSSNMAQFPPEFACRRPAWPQPQGQLMLCIHTLKCHITLLNLHADAEAFCPPPPPPPRDGPLTCHMLPLDLYAAGKCASPHQGQLMPCIHPYKCHMPP